MQTDLLKLLPQFDVISFDVFDTLLLRPYLRQEDLWLDMGRRAFGENGGVSFLKARIGADRKTYARATARGGEHDLHGAYLLMPKKYAALEVEEEKLQRDCLFVNGEMLEVWKRAGELGKKRIVVSDMYLNEAWFERTLREKGLGDYDGLYVSSTRQARKSTGLLFECVRADWSGAKILHIGDNERSDVEKAKAHGLAAWRYPNFREKLLRDWPCLLAFVENYPTVEKRLLLGELVAGWRECACDAEASAGNDGSAYWKRLGFFFGGVLGWLYVSWLAKAARERKIDHLMFVARDGYLWKQMFDRLETGIRTDYFYAPRMTSIKVCGVIGSDRWAVADRRKILESLPPFDAEAERRRYGDYLAQFKLGRGTAIVDGISSAFSVQSLVGKTAGRQIPAFYLMALAQTRNGEALFPHRTPWLGWQQLAEFIFSSPERPIDDFNVRGPLYRENVAEQEQYRESIFGDLADGALAGFDTMHWSRIVGASSGDNRQIWIDLVESLQTHMTAEDERYLAQAQNATNVRQDNFTSVQRPELNSRITRRFGIPLGRWRGHSTPEFHIETFYALGRLPIWRRIIR